MSAPVRKRHKSNDLDFFKIAVTLILFKTGRLMIIAANNTNKPATYCCDCGIKLLLVPFSWGSGGGEKKLACLATAIKNIPLSSS